MTSAHAPGPTEGYAMLPFLIFHRMHSFARLCYVVGVAQTVRGSNLFKNSSVTIYSLVRSIFSRQCPDSGQLSRGRVGFARIQKDIIT